MAYNYTNLMLKGYVKLLWGSKPYSCIYHEL